MIGRKKLIIIGDSSFAEIAYEYFTHDSSYEVVAFSIEQKYLKKTELFGLPIIPFEELSGRFNPNTHSIYVAVVYTELNRLRTRLYLQAKSWGYGIASYISSKAFVWPNVVVGEHCFIFENNVIQPFVKIGNNNIFWSGNHIGHHTVIQDHCFFASHVVLSGHCRVEDNCFFGVNSTIAHQVSIAKDAVIGAGALIMRDTLAEAVYKGDVSKGREQSSHRIFKVKETSVAHEVV
jgi:sugar O-acyltransferase (sialic acid O-acetyltransferase NeuD family)